MLISSRNEVKRVIYNLAAIIVKLFLNIFGRLKIYQKEKLPSEQDEGFLIACTHTGWVDILWLGVAVYPVKIHYMAKIELFQNRLLKWLMEKLNAFPVNRENPGPSAIKIPRRLLRDGEVVGIFPSGTRTSEEVPLKRGAVTIASRSKSPIIPAAYVGPNNFKDLLKRKKPRIIFGDPIHVSEDLPRREAIEKMMIELNDALIELQSKIE